MSYNYTCSYLTYIYGSKSYSLRSSRVRGMMYLDEHSSYDSKEILTRMSWTDRYLAGETERNPGKLHSEWSTAGLECAYLHNAYPKSDIKITRPGTWRVQL